MIAKSIGRVHMKNASWNLCGESVSMPRHGRTAVVLVNDYRQKLFDTALRARILQSMTDLSLEVVRPSSELVLAAHD